MFNSLQFDDYNKKLTGSENFYKLLKKQPSQNEGGGNDTVVFNLDRPLLKNRKKQKKESWWEYLTNCCRSKSSKRSAKKERKRLNKKKKQWEQMMTGFVKTDSFYENYDFQNRGIRKNWKKFLEYVISGSNHLNNKFAALSSVSSKASLMRVLVFAFVDKEGIISETGKYVDEIGLIDNKEEKTVFDLIHDSNVKKEEEIYSFEN